jgi:hypothetical protein
VAKPEDKSHFETILQSQVHNLLRYLSSTLSSTERPPTLSSFRTFSQYFVENFFPFSAKPLLFDNPNDVSYFTY